MPPKVLFGSAPAASQKRGDLDKLSKLQAKLRQCRTTNRAQAQAIADLTGPDTPCVAFGIPLCAGCKDFHAQAECEKGLLRALEEKSQDLEDLRDLQHAQKYRQESESAEITLSINTSLRFLEQAQHQLDANNLILGYTLYHSHDSLLLNEAPVQTERAAAFTGSQGLTSKKPSLNKVQLPTQPRHGSRNCKMLPYSCCCVQLTHRPVSKSNSH